MEKTLYQFTLSYYSKQHNKTLFIRLHHIFRIHLFLFYGYGYAFAE